MTRLKTQITNGKKLPMTSNVVIDRDAALDLVEELQAAIPEEIRAAKRINSEGERILEKAQQEADQVLGRAQEQAAFLIDERGLRAAADEEARRIVAEAHYEGAEIRRGADEYAVSVLVGLEGEVVRTLQSIKKGVALLDERRQALAIAAASDGQGPAGDDGRSDESTEEEPASRSART